MLALVRGKRQRVEGDEQPVHDFGVPFGERLPPPALGRQHSVQLGAVPIEVRRQPRHASSRRLLQHRTVHDEGVTRVLSPHRFVHCLARFRRNLYERNLVKDHTTWPRYPLLASPSSRRSTFKGSMPQMSVAYARMVSSLEKWLAPAMLRMAQRAHADESP